MQLVPRDRREQLRGYSWPGNVRELRNVVERSVLLAESEVFPSRWLNLVGDPSASAASRGESGLSIPVDGSMSLDEIERLVITDALERNDHNVTRTARAMGTTRQTLRYRMEKHGLDRKD